MGRDQLFSSFELKNHRLRNRIGVAPMTRMSSQRDSIPRQDVLDFLARRAKNGAAIVYTEAIVTDYESAQGYPGQARILTQRQIDGWRPVVRAIQDAGAVAMMQMFHCGRMPMVGQRKTGIVLPTKSFRPFQKSFPRSGC